jgi:hypothetical protein
MNFSGTYSVALGVSSQESYSSATPITGLTAVVTSHEATTGVTEFEIEFDQHFKYDGGNLVVQFQVNNPAPNSYTNTYWAGTDMGYNVGYYSQYNGLVQVLPKATFIYVSSIPSVATPTFSPAAGTYNSAQQVTILCATEGATIRDGYYKTNHAAARKAGLLVGSYHVYSSKTTAYQQFNNFKSLVHKKSQDLIPVLDIEGHHSGRLYMARVDKLLELMEKEYGAKPMIYTSEKVYKLHFSGKKYRKYHIFIANYRRTPSVRYTLWQYTETGHISGIAGCVDFSKFDRNHSLSDILMPKKKKKKDDTDTKVESAATDSTDTSSSSDTDSTTAK